MSRLLAATLVIFTFGCGPSQEKSAEAAPIVVITLGAFPAHLVGALGGESGWTPHLDGLANEAWGVRAIAPSSSPIPSLASLLTGVDAWNHQLVSHRASELRADVPTIPAILGHEWSRSAYFPLDRRFQDFGVLEDFDTVEDLPAIDVLQVTLRELEGPSFVWIHLRGPAFPWLDRSKELPRLGPRRGSFEKVERRWLMPYADPELPIPEPLLSESQELLRHQIAWADDRLGLLLAALRENPRWQDLWLVVTALHGTEMGQHGQVLFAQNLERAGLEVPFFVKPGPGRERQPRSLPFTSTARLAATVAEVAGRRPGPALAPSIFDAPQSALSSLYDHGGVNRLSLVRGAGPGRAVQLLWGQRYAPEEPEMWAALAVEAGLGSLPIGESPRSILGRVRGAFRNVHPLRGRGAAADLRLVRWAEGGGVEELEEQATETRMANQLISRWRLFHSVERTPDEALAYWSDE